MDSFSVNKILHLRNQPTLLDKLLICIPSGVLQYSVPKIAAFDMYTRYVKTIFRLTYVVGKRILILGSRMLMDGQTPTSGRLCRVYRPFKTSVFSLVLA